MGKRDPARQGRRESIALLQHRGLLLIHATPLIVEAGILLDLTVGVFVIGIIVDRIQREFDTLDTRKLNVLRE